MIPEGGLGSGVGMYEWFMTVVLGVVEGLTEFVPVSSTGHLLLVEKLCGVVRGEIFNIGIQTGAVLGVVFVYWERLWGLAKDWRKRENWEFILKCGAAFVVTAILGLLVRKMGFSLEDSNMWAVTWAVLIGGILFLWAEEKIKGLGEGKEIGWWVVAVIGVAQVLAGIFPGLSRSGSTIIAAMLMGVGRMKATEFSFILGIPTMFAASGYVLVEEMVQGNKMSPEVLGHFALGFVVSLIVGFGAVKWLLGYVRKNSFKVFGWYRVALGLGLCAWLLTGGRGT